MKIGFIGAGNMGLPLIKGACKAFGNENVGFATENQSLTQKILGELSVDHPGISGYADNAALVSSCDIVVFAVKPQFFDIVVSQIKPLADTNKLYFTIMAGLSMESIQKALSEGTDRKPDSYRIVRAMPNTAAMVGEAMVCVCKSESATDEDLALAKELYSAVGLCEEIPEKLMAAATCANGSSPAYVYMFMEALADSVVKYGIPRALAYKLVAQTVLGSAKMLLESGKHPGELKDGVCSPGGTTIAGVAALEEYGMRNAIIKATDACYEKATNIK